MIQDPVIFTDATLLVVDYIRSAMPGVPVYSRIPDPRPAGDFIRIERLGGLRNSIVTDRPRIDVECWSDTEFNAQSLCSRARAHMGAIAGTRGASVVYRVAEVAGPQWLPDTQSGQPRYSFAVEFSTRGNRME